MVALHPDTIAWTQAWWRGKRFHLREHCGERWYELRIKTTVKEALAHKLRLCKWCERGITRPGEVTERKANS